MARHRYELTGRAIKLEITATLKSLGASSSDGQDTKYSVVEIGDTLLNNVRISTSLDNFLRKGLNRDEITIYATGRSNGVIGAVRLDGKTYVAAPFMNRFILVLGIALGIITIPLFLAGIGLIIKTLVVWSNEKWRREYIASNDPNCVVVMPVVGS